MCWNSFTVITAYLMDDLIVLRKKGSWEGLIWCGEIIYMYTETV